MDCLYGYLVNINGEVSFCRLFLESVYCQLIYIILIDTTNNYRLCNEGYIAEVLSILQTNTHTLSKKYACII